MNELSIGILCTIGGFALSYFGFLRNSKKDTKEEAGNSTRVEIKLDYAIIGINEIKDQIKDTRNDITGLKDRMTRAEEKIDNANKRIDSLQEGGTK